MPRLDFITFVIIMLMGPALQVTDIQVGSKDVKPKYSTSRPSTCNIRCF